jgi:hypothetical protein
MHAKAARRGTADARQSRQEASPLPPARRHWERALGWALAGTRIRPGGGRRRRRASLGIMTLF